MTKDIDISGENWTPIGTIEEPFTGTLDGNGHTISGLTIEEELYMENEEYYIGLFGVLQGGSHTNAVTISDLTLEGTIVLRGGQGIDNEELELWLQAGALAAEVNWAIFDNCTNRVNITADFSMTQDTDDMNLYVAEWSVAVTITAICISSNARMKEKSMSKSMEERRLWHTPEGSLAGA